MAEEKMAQEQLNAPKRKRPDEPSAEEIEKATTAQMKGERRVRIRIASGSLPHERGPVSVGVNGVAYQIPRDKDVDVPVSVLKVLQNAKQQMPHKVEEHGRKRVEFQEVLRFPVSVVGYVNKETGKLEG